LLEEQDKKAEDAMVEMKIRMRQERELLLNAAQESEEEEDLDDYGEETKSEIM
jgi:hypothetical protein